MSKATLIVDGETRIDGELSEWNRRELEELAASIKPEANPEPYLVAVGWFLGEAAMKGRSVCVTVGTRDSGFSIDVTYGAF